MLIERAYAHFVPAIMSSSKLVKKVSGQLEAASPDMKRLKAFRSKYHADCMACSDTEYQLQFDIAPDGVMIGRIIPSQKLHSYSGVLHGGVISLLIDEAMTCCLMAYGVVGVTVELTLRFRESSEPGTAVEIHTRLTHSSRQLYQLESILYQGGKTRVTATAKFMKKKGP